MPSQLIWDAVGAFGALMKITALFGPSSYVDSPTKQRDSFVHPQTPEIPAYRNVWHGHGLHFGYFRFLLAYFAFTRALAKITNSPFSSSNLNLHVRMGYRRSWGCTFVRNVLLLSIRGCGWVQCNNFVGQTTADK
jgi:hypothetical protein